MTARPNFYIIGAGRSGSTSLYAHCRSHPQILMSQIKEPNYYIFRDERPPLGGPRVGEARAAAVRDARTYARLFEPDEDRPIAGEASINYLRFSRVARAIREETPEAKLVIMLRQPVDRAYSSFVRSRLEGTEPCERFEEAWRDHDRRAGENWWHGMHKGKSLYLSQVRAYLDVFPREQLRFLVFEEFARNPSLVLHELWTFLGVDQAAVRDPVRRHNESGEIDNWVLRQLWRRTGRLRAVLMPAVPVAARGRLFPFLARQRRRAPATALAPDLRERLTDELRDEILRLQDLVDRDLSEWLRHSDAARR